MHTELDNLGRVTNDMCTDAIKRMSCATAFPQCPSSGSTFSSYPYLPPCKRMCEQINSLCLSYPKNRDGIGIDCDSYQTENCLLYMPPGFFVLPDDRGDISGLPRVYFVCLGSWLIISILWWYNVFYKYKNKCLPICRLVTIVPVMKCSTLVFGASFWTTCVSWNMCSYWISVVFINLHVVFETTTIFAFLLYAKGWTLTREKLRSDEWRMISLCLSAFYLGASIMLVIKDDFSYRGYMTGIGLMYGLLYFVIINELYTKCYYLIKHYRMLKQNLVPDEITSPVRNKMYMFLFFVFLVGISIMNECIVHSLVDKDRDYMAILSYYEISNLILFGAILVLWRPVEYSPFFFMVPSQEGSTEDEEQEVNRHAIILDAIEENEGLIGTAEVPQKRFANIDTAPLDGPNVELVPAKMLVIRNPLNYKVGISYNKDEL